MAFRVSLLAVLVFWLSVANSYANVDAAGEGPRDQEGEYGGRGDGEGKGGKGGKGCGGKGGRRLKGSGPGMRGVATTSALDAVAEDVSDLTDSSIMDDDKDLAGRRLQPPDDMERDDDDDDDREECGFFDNPTNIIGLVVIGALQCVCIGGCCFGIFYWYLPRQKQKQLLLQQQSQQQSRSWGGGPIGGVPMQQAAATGVAVADDQDGEPTKPGQAAPTTVVVGSPIP